MFNVCPACGEYAVEKSIDPIGPDAVCPFCGHRHRFLRLPLFLITGASGTGKTAVALRLGEYLPEFVVLEGDILWRAEFDTPADNYAAYRDSWLRLAKNIHQAGRSVVLCGSAVPEQYEDRPERRYFSDLHYLALVCDDRVLADRLKRRPAWRDAGADDFVARMVRFNRWIRDNAERTQPPMTLLDTSRDRIEETVERAAIWVRDRVAPATGRRGGE